MSEAAEARRMSEMAALLSVIHTSDPEKLRRDLNGAVRAGPRRTGTGRQGQNGGGGVKVGDLIKMFGKPKVAGMIPPGAK